MGGKCLFMRHLLFRIPRRTHMCYGELLKVLATVRNRVTLTDDFWNVGCGFSSLNLWVFFFFLSNQVAEYLLSTV